MVVATCERQSNSWIVLMSYLRAPARFAAVDALVAGAVADHDAAAAGAGWRVVEHVHRPHVRQRRRGGGGRDAVGRVGFDHVHARTGAFRLGEELRGEPAEDV